MKFLSVILLVLFTQVLTIAAQDSADWEMRAREVRAAVEKMVAAGHTKVMGVRKDLRVFEGSILRNNNEDYVIKPKKKSSRRSVETIKYSDVLEIEGTGFVLSYFPDPNQKPFADWTAVRRLQHGDSLDIDLEGNDSAFGVLLKISETDITLLDGNRNVVVARDRIVRILLARRDTPGAKRILKGAAGGAGSVKSGSAGSSTGAAIVNTALMTAGAVAGAVNAAAKRWPNDRLLIYAK